MFSKKNNNSLPDESRLVSKKHFFIKCVILLFFGISLILAFPPFNISFLGWIGIIPLYLLVISLNWKRAFLAGFVWGYGWSLASTFWLKGIEPFIPWVFSLVLACFYAFWALAVPVCRRYIFIPPKIQLDGYESTEKYLNSNSFILKEIIVVLFLSCWWVIIEWIRTWIFTGFPWNLYAITQWQKIGLIQIASVTGIYGVSFIVIFLNLSIAHAFINIYKKVRYNNIISRFRIVPISLYLGIMLIIVSFYYGIKKLNYDRGLEQKSTDLKTAVVQGDLPQLRFYDEKEAAYALDVYTGLSKKVLPFKPDILIWPESAVPQPLRGVGYLSERYRENISELLRKYRVPILLGTIDFGFGQRKANGEIPVYNSALMLGLKAEDPQRYSKMHLVPWGEYTPGEFIFPLKYIYPWIKKTFGMGRSLTPGTENTIFKFKKDVDAATLICYEDAFPEIAREHVLAGANLLVTITNDAWFPTRDELQQHLAMAVFRSVENNRMMIRVGNCAGTCVIQPNGVISDSLFFKNNNMYPNPEEKGRATGIFNVKVPEVPGLTFYTKFGNVFIFICIVIAGLIVVWMLWNWKDKKMLLLKEIEK